jgi:hypothetical protein
MSKSDYASPGAHDSGETTNVQYRIIFRRYKTRLPAGNGSGAG